MIEYGRAIDAQISQLLQVRRYVTPEMIAGTTPEEAATLLNHYVEIHGGEVPLVFDGERMTWAETPANPGDPSAKEPLSPVDQVLDLPRTGSLLDTAPSGGKVPGWLWLVVVAFGLPGGLIAWFVAKDTNRSTAKAMLITSVVITVASVMLPLAMLPSLQSAVPVTASWPASASGAPTFYYFGSAT